MSHETTDSNDTILLPSGSQAVATMSLPGISASPNSESQIMEPPQISILRQISRLFIDPFGLLRRVVENSKLPPPVAEFTFFAVLSLTALWDIALIILTVFLAWRLLVALGYLVKKMSFLICCMSSGMNKKFIKQILWNQMPRKRPWNERNDELTTFKSPI